MPRYSKAPIQGYFHASATVVSSSPSNFVFVIIIIFVIIRFIIVVKEDVGNITASLGLHHALLLAVLHGVCRGGTSLLCTASLRAADGQLGRDAEVRPDQDRHVPRTRIQRHRYAESRRPRVAAGR